VLIFAKITAMTEVGKDPNNDRKKWFRNIVIGVGAAALLLSL
jgi:hypothetical protein